MSCNRFSSGAEKGESGIRSVECLVDGAVWRAADEGRWSKELMNAALSRTEKCPAGRPEAVEHPAIWLIEYNDGTRGGVLALEGHAAAGCLAAFHVKGRKEIDSTLCYMPVESRNDYSMLVHGIARMMVTGTCPYPVERSLLTSGALSFLGASAARHTRIETPALQVTYAAPEHSFYAHGRGW